MQAPSSLNSTREQRSKDGEYWAQKLSQTTDSGRLNTGYKSTSRKAGREDKSGGGHKTHHEESSHKSSGHDEGTWIFSYADMITILMMFFILLLSISNVSPQKFKAMQESMKKLDKEKPEQEPPKVTPQEKKKPGSIAQGIDFDALKDIEAKTEGSKEEKIIKAAAYLVSTIKSELLEKNTEELEVYEQLKDKLTTYSKNLKATKAQDEFSTFRATFPARYVFESESGKISLEGSDFLKKLVQKLQPQMSKIQLQVNVHTSMYKSRVTEAPNFMGPFKPVALNAKSNELTSSWVLRESKEAQSLTVTRSSELFTELIKLGLSADKIAGSGYGNYRILVSERSEKGLIRSSAVQTNDRIEFAIVRPTRDVVPQ